MKTKAHIKTVKNFLRDWVKKYDDSEPEEYLQFYTSQEWKDRGEEYCTNADLIIVFESSVMYSAVNHEHGFSMDEDLRVGLEELGYYMELGTSWYGGLYPTN